MIVIVLFLISAATCANGHPLLSATNLLSRPKQFNESPKPYSFNYRIQLDEGTGQISRYETADDSGKVQGSYSLDNGKGHFRFVDYIADENGFCASIRTNEPGTGKQNPADVVMESIDGPLPFGEPFPLLTKYSMPQPTLPTKTPPKKYAKSGVIRPGTLFKIEAHKAEKVSGN